MLCYKFTQLNRLRACLALMPALLGALASISATANAQEPELCMSLESRLAALQNGGNITDSQEYRRYDTAYHKQRDQLIKAQREATKAGCRISGLRLFQSSQCRDFNQTIATMRANLQKIDAQRSRFIIDPRQTERTKQELILALGRNRCGAQYERIAQAHDRQGRRTLFASNLFETFEEPLVYGYRTLCVRTCDGYYFPVSFSTLSRHFMQDEAKCKTMFPGTDVELFYYQNASTDTVKSARSLDGRFYEDMSYAFQYRQRYDKSCRFTRRYEQEALEIAAVSQLASGSPPRKTLFGPYSPVPIPRPDFGLDPEMAMNRLGGFTPKAQPLPPALAQNPHIRNGQKVKIVGPAFFYGQSTAKVLSSPVRTSVQ